MKKDIENRTDLLKMMKAFYKTVLADELLIPLFDAADVDWEAHYPIMVDFWETTLFHTGNYKRNAMQPHLDLNQRIPFKKEHFDRWLEIFQNTVDELFIGEVAHNAKTRALSIATIMQVKMYSKDFI